VTGPVDILLQAKARGDRALSEFEAKRLFGAYGISITRERLAKDRASAIALADELGGPVVLKGCHPTLLHKTEMHMVRLGVQGGDAVGRAYDDLAARLPLGGSVLVQEMVAGKRELILGLMRDPQFGACVSVGIGGIFAETLRDVVFRLVPIDRIEALAMLDELKFASILGEVRGMPPVDREGLASALVALGRIGEAHPEILEIDINPMIIAGSRPIAVDALIVLRAE
jgi:acetyl-CoA synthetase (ADP-forming)